MRATRHKAFSPARVAAVRLEHAARTRALEGLYFMRSLRSCSRQFAFLVRFTFQQQFQVLKDVSLGAMSIFTWLLATLATAMLLPKDIEDRTLYTILAKPVPRIEYLLGKLFGVLAMLLIALLCMSALFLIVLFAREQIVLAETTKITPPGELEAALNEVRATTFNINLLPGIAIIYVKAAVVAAMTLLLSSFATSILIIVRDMFVTGHLQPIAREHWLGAVLGGTVASPALKLFLIIASRFRFPIVQSRR
jgi:hypothetical protein